MESFLLVLQVIIALGIINVWVLRRNKATTWRPEGAQNMVQEFRHYGLPDWFLPFIGTVKVSLAVLLLAGIWYQPLALVAAAAMGALMLAAVIVHLNVRDPLAKAAPAFSLFLLCLVVSVGHAL